MNPASALMAYGSITMAEFFVAFYISKGASGGTLVHALSTVLFFLWVPETDPL